jgi:hypothetical protein
MEFLSLFLVAAKDVQGSLFALPLSTINLHIIIQTDQYIVQIVVLAWLFDWKVTYNRHHEYRAHVFEEIESPSPTSYGRWG